jgi:hypothetical protein
MIAFLAVIATIGALSSVAYGSPTSTLKGAGVR